MIAATPGWHRAVAKARIRRLRPFLESVAQGALAAALVIALYLFGVIR